MERIREFLEKAKQFFREVRVELKKVTWPSRKETIASTSVVLVTVFLVGFYLGIVDLGLSRLIRIFLE
jgi:preprotein translocase subunit SecE